MLRPSRKNKRSFPDTPEATVLYYRMGLGLPLNVRYRRPPMGYYKHPKYDEWFFPDWYELLLLHKCYQLKENSVPLQDIVAYHAEKMGRKKPMSVQQLSMLYRDRPIFDEITLPIYDRLDIYRRTFAEAEGRQTREGKETTERLYEDCFEEEARIKERLGVKP